MLEVEGQPSGLGWMPDGSLLVVSMRDRRILRWDGSSTTVHADVAEHCGAAPDFIEQARSAKHEAVLLTTTVDVPHAGLP